MSRTIDERVVEMRFDNKQFESGVQTSLSTLEKLKKGLDLDGAAKGFDQLSTAAKRCDMSAIGRSVETFGKDIASFGTDMSNYYAKVASIDLTKLAGVITQVWSLVDLTKGVKGLDASGFTSFGNALKAMANTGISEFTSAFSNSTTEVNKAVQGMLNSVSASTSNGKTLTTPGMESVMKSLADVVTKKATEINNSVTTLMKGVATTIRNSGPSVKSATQAAFAGAVSTLNSLKPQFETAGKNAGQGFVNGISSKLSSATAAGKSLGLAALNAAKKALDSHSPSREFIHLGENMGEGLAIGAKNSIVPASQATSKMIDEVLKVSSKGIKAFQEWTEEKKYYGELSLKDELAGYENLQKRYKAGSEERIKIDREVYRIQNELVAATYQASIDWIEEEKYYNRLSTQEELEAYERMQQRYLEGSEERKKIDREVYTLRKQLMDESYQHSMDWIEEEKYYNRMSLSDELAAYKRVQSRYAKGTDERKKMDREVYRLEQEIYEAQKQYISDVQSVQAEANQKRLDLEEEYANKVKSVNEKLASDIQSLNMQYVVEFDIKGFFDNVDHSKLIKQMWALGIRDKHLIYIIKRILKAPVQLENGAIVTPDKGTPQGGIISPLLANIVLNELDWWIDSQWQNHPVAVARGKNRKIKERVVFDKSHGYKIMRNTQLKEMHIVRYADDFRIFCPTKDCAERTLIAVTQWLKERLRLDVSPEKTRVVNLNKHYSEFLGIKMRLRQKKNKQIVQSRVSEKAVKRITAEAKRKIKDIARPPKGMTEARAILNYNAFVMGEHEYYQMATGVSVDFRDINYQVSRTMKRLGDRLKKEPKDKIGGAVVDRYGSSKLIRYIKNLPIAPISYVRTSGPKYKNPLIQKYTPEGRARIHENLAFNTRMLHALLRQEVHSQSAAYADNRLSLFCAQYGKCAVTEQVFESLGDIHCHHKLPSAMGGKDNYQNLILVRESVHILIHATSDSTIAKYLSQLALNKKQLAKLNKLRKEAGNPPISA